MPGVGSSFYVCQPLTNAYFTPMILGIWLCSDLQEYLAKAGKKDKGLLVIYLVEVLVAGLILFGICYIMGYFYGEVSVSTTGLEELSFNLLQFLIRAMIFASLITGTIFSVNRIIPHFCRPFRLYPVGRKKALLILALA